MIEAILQNWELIGLLVFMFISIVESIMLAEKSKGLKMIKNHIDSDSETREEIIKDIADHYIGKFFDRYL